MTADGAPGRPNRPPTMKEIAVAAGVGLGTVSRALSDGHHVSAATRARVQDAARELRYRSSALGRGLKRQQTDTIGLIVADLSNPFYGEFAQGVLTGAQARNRHVIVGSSGEDPASELDYIDLLLEQRVGGIIAFPTGQNIESWEAARALGVRIVFADRTIDGFDAPSVVVDNAGGARELTQHLIDLGHQRIGYLGGPLDVSSGRLREEGYRAALAGAGIPAVELLIVRQGFIRETAHAHALRLLDERPSAIVASNNVLGEAVLAALRDRGLRYPADVSIAIFDDVPWSRLTQPAMTVQAQPSAELSRTAVELLLSNEAADAEIMLPTQLIVRESTRTFTSRL